MPRTAPTVNGTPASKLVSYRFVDAQGDTRAVSHRVLTASATDAEIEALGEALAAKSNAALYSIVVSEEYSAVPDADDATDAVVNSARSNIVVTAKNTTGDLKQIFLPAPVEAMFIPGTDTPIVDANYTDIFTAFLATLPAGFEIVSVRYSERKEVNERVLV